MAQQTINVGAAPNDGTGTPLRTAFQYTNSNFSELYAALGGGSGLPGSANQVLFNNGTAIAGDAGMTYNPSTDTMSLVNLVLSGTFAARNGDTPSAIRAAASDYAAVTFDGATASTRITSTLTGQNIGTGDVSLWTRFRVPSNGPRGLIALSSSPTDSAAANAFSVYPNTSGSLVARIFGASTNDFRQAAVANFLSAYVGQVVDVVVTRAGNTLKIYINGADAAYTETTNGTPPNWSDTITSSFLRVGLISSTEVFNGRIYRSVVFNRALSASDVTELITVGVNPADQWGTQTAVYTSDFSAGADGWAGTRGTSDGNIDGISGVDNTLRFTVDSTASNTHYAFRSSVPGLLAGKRYRVGFNYFITAANATMNGLRLQQLTTVQNITPIQSVTGAWTSITPVEFVSTETRLDVLGYAGANNSFTGNGTDTFYLHSFVLTRIGAIVDLDFTIGGGSTAYDRSTNGLDGTLFGGVSWTMPRDGQYINGPSTITGAASAAGLSVTGSTIPTNGVYLPSANNLGFAYNSTLGMTLNSTGLGVGTSPASLLHISGLSPLLNIQSNSSATATTASLVFTMSTLNTAKGAEIIAERTGASAASALRFHTNDTAGISTERMRIDASGNVGIGVTSPAAKLHVEGSGPQARFSTASAADARHEYYRNGIREGLLFWNENLIGLYATQATGELVLASANTIRVRINSAGDTISNVTGTAPTLSTNSQMVFNLTSNTNLRISVRGTDGVTRTANITLA